MPAPSESQPESQMESQATQPSATQPAPTQSAATAPAATQPALTQPVHAERLAQLGANGWHAVPLPQDWPTDGPTDSSDDKPTKREVVLLAPRDTSGALRLLVRDDGQNDGRTWRVYTRRTANWQRQDYTLDSAAPLTVLRVNHQLVIVQPQQVGDGQVTVRFSVLRSGKQRTVGSLTVHAPGAQQWGAAPVGLSAALVVQGKATGKNNDQNKGNEKTAFRFTASTLQGLTVGDLWWCA